MRKTIIFGGEAGQGPNILSQILGEALVKQGYYVFYSRDYQSLIRGGHNFNILTFSDKPVYSNDSKADILVALDEKTEKIHTPNLNKGAIILKGSKENMYYAGRLFKLLCMDFKLLENEFKLLEARFEENMEESKKGYDEEEKKVCEIIKRKENLSFMNGSKAIALGAVKSGIDIYYAYPMTPSTGVLRELAGMQKENNFFVFEPENEISGINMAVGSAITGARAMTGSSGGGFDMMTETISLAGMIEVPLVIYLSQRPGPATGVPTYNSQGDLNTARFSGHGEFPRMLLAPGDTTESEELTNQAFYFAEKFKVPCIVINDKHLAESAYSTKGEPKIVKFEKSTPLTRHSGNETNKEGITTTKVDEIKWGVETRMKKMDDMRQEATKFVTHKFYGNKNSKNLIVFWGSTKGAILDAIGGMDCKALQILYLKPFPIGVKEEMEKAEELILVENNESGELAGLIAEKTGIFFKDENKILKYDGRPFFCDELKKEIEERLK